MLELASEHRSALAEDLMSAQSGFQLPTVPDVLADEKTGLKEIARYLLTPTYSGFYLSRDDLSRLASGLGIPRGFGSREQMLTNLLRAAADYEQLALLAERLGSFLDSWIGFYAELSGDERPLTPFAAPWLERLRLTQALLARVVARIK